MNTSHIQNKINKSQTTLYVIVFEIPQIKFAVTLLLGFILMQPIAPIFAADDTLPAVADTTQVEKSVEPAVAEDDAVKEVIDTQSIEASEIQSEDQTTEKKSKAETTSHQTSPNTELVLKATSSESTTHEPEFNILATSSQAVAPHATSSETDVFETASTTDADVVASSTSEEFASSTQAAEGVEPLATSTTSTQPVEVIPVRENEPVTQADTESPSVEVGIVKGTTTDSTATSTNANATTTQKSTIPNTSYVNNSDSTHQFSDTECVSVGDGAFYCSENKEAPEFIKDGVYARQDSDGDTEIYIRIEGKEQQITHNIVDDSSPYFDAFSKRIVWHQSVHDRFQIMSYDIKTQEEVALTDESYNNMEAVAYGDITLWQAWIGDNWEIIKYENGSTTQLTSNTMHDISPHMRGGHILWQTQFADGWQVAVYDITTNSIEYIASGNGAKIENPRMVLVYESTDSNGDVQTMGYDFDLKSGFQLGVLPSELPDELPDPDQTGETRALIQTKPSLKEVEVVQTSPVDSGNGNTGTSTDAQIATSTQVLSENHTLDISASSTPSVATSTESVAQSVIPDVVMSTTTTQEIIHTDTVHIDDVVIPPFMGTTTDEVS